MAEKRAEKGKKRASSKARSGKRKTAAENRPPKADVGNGELIDMREAIRLLKTTRPTFYRWLRSGKIRGMKVGRQWRFYREDIERFLKGAPPRVDLPAGATPLMRALLKQVHESGSRKVSLEAFKEDVSDAQRVIRLIILLAVASKASDIHISPHVCAVGGETAVFLRYRIDGVLQESARIDMRLLPAIIEEWKRMAGCDVREKRRSQDGRLMIDLAEGNPTMPQKVIDIWINFLPTALGESLTARTIDKSTASFDLKLLGYRPRDQEKILKALAPPSGLLLVTGPVGSGKTTTLYSCLSKLAGPGKKTMTVEDPVEFHLPWVTQVHLRPSEGVTFQNTIRSFLRSAVDVMMVGEIRDYETLSLAQAAALTGHLVLITLHTDDAVGALRRMVDLGGDPFLVADATRLVIAQRLIRKLCPHCNVEDRPESNRLDLAAQAARKGGLTLEASGALFRKAVGCDKCAKTGYRGRTLVAEVLEMTGEIGRALRSGASADELRTLAVGEGMTTMAADGLRRAAAGETTLDEIMRVIG